MEFEFASAGRILFGEGTLRKTGPMAREFGQRALVVTGSNTGRVAPLLSELGQQQVEYTLFPVGGEPEVATVQEGVTRARSLGCELVISFGGGSAIDAGKAIAAMLQNEGGLLDYLEVIGRGRTLSKPAAPFIAIPTTAGTGSETTRNAVLAAPERRVKVSLRSPLMLPRVAIVDPQLTYDLPAAITAWTGLDALTQLIEPYVSPRANPMTDSLCLEGIRRVARSLIQVFAAPRDQVGRRDMALASLFGGLALANAGLGAVHGLAGPLGGMFPAPHGALCAALLPQVFEMNIRALKRVGAGGEALARFERIAQLLTGNDRATTADGGQWLKALIGRLAIPGLTAYGISRADFEEIATKAAHASSMKANPVALSRDELVEVLERSL